MNPPLAKKDERAGFRAKGKKKSVTLRFDESVQKAVKTFAVRYDLKIPDAIALLITIGVDALTPDTLKPIAKIQFPAVWEWIERNKIFIETAKRLYTEDLKELRDKIKIKEEKAE
jgi:hypothetical protein